MAAINLSNARTLCTAAELSLVKSSSKQSLAKMSAGEAKKKVDQARKLRDKWRDLATRQTRQVQRKQGARVTDDNARSQEKADLFGEVLARFEDHLAKVSDAGDGAKPTRKPPKKVRAQEHRETRAAARKQLDTKRSRIASARSSAAKKPAAKAVAEEQAADPVKKKAATKAKASKTVKAKKKTAKKAAAPLKAAVALPNGPLKTQQQKAVTATKRARLKTSGVDTRVRGHVSARGKRTQARRDSKR